MRRPTRQMSVSWADRVVRIGGDAPVVVQSMTNTDSADAIATAIQVKELAQAGIGDRAHHRQFTRSGCRCRAIREQLDKMGIDVPLVGDFHYNGHKLLTQFPACAEALSKYRINPGNVGRGAKGERQVRADDRGGLPLSQAGAHRRQLGQARPGTAREDDGRERARAPSRWTRRR